MCSLEMYPRTWGRGEGKRGQEEESPQGEGVLTMGEEKELKNIYFLKLTCGNHSP